MFFLFTLAPFFSSVASVLRHNFTETHLVLNRCFRLLFPNIFLKTRSDSGSEFGVFVFLYGSRSSLVMDPGYIKKNPSDPVALKR